VALHAARIRPTSASAPTPSSPQHPFPTPILSLLAHPIRLCNNRAEQNWMRPLCSSQY